MSYPEQQQAVTKAWGRYQLRVTIWFFSGLCTGFALLTGSYSWNALRIVVVVLWSAWMIFLVWDYGRTRRLMRRGEWPALGSPELRPRTSPDEAYITKLRRRRRAD